MNGEKKDDCLLCVSVVAFKPKIINQRNSTLNVGPENVLGINDTNSL